MVAQPIGSLKRATRPVGRHLRLLAELGALAALLVLACLFLLRAPIQQAAALELGASDRGSVAGFYPAEIGYEDSPLRWTDGAASIRLPAQGAGPHLLLLRLAAPQSTAPAGTPAAITVNGSPIAALRLDAAPRQYRLLVPARELRWGDNQIGIASGTVVPPRDERALGVAAFVVRLAALEPQGWLAWVQLGALVAATAALWLAMARLGAGAPVRLLVVALFLLISVTMRQSDLRFVPRWSAVALSAALAGSFTLAALVARPDPRRAAPGAARLGPGWWPAVALFAGLTALLFWRLWPAVTTGLFGGRGDNYEYAWKLQWFVDALAAGRSPTFVPYSFYPGGYELGMSEITPAHTLLGLPLTAALGPAASFNTLLFLSYTLTALIAACYAERLGAPRLGALVAGVGVAFCVYRFAHMQGILPQMGTQWVLLALYGWEGFLQRRRAGDAVVAALGLGLAFWSSLYYGAILTPLLVLYTLLRLRWGAVWSLRSEWRALLLAALIVVAMVAPYAQPFIEAQAGNEVRRFRYQDLVELGARPGDFLSPNPFHPLRHLVPLGPPHRYIALGITLTALAAIGLWLQRRSRIAWALAGIGLMGALLALGPELRVGGLTLPLPVSLIYAHVPVLQSIRDWSRLAFYTQIAVAALAALAFVGWRARPLWGRAALVALAALVLFESLALPWTDSPLGPRPVDHFLAAQPGTGAVIQIPDVIAGSNLYYTLHHHRPIAVGYGTYFPPIFHEQIWWLIAFPVLPEVVPLYQRLGVEYVLVHKEQMPPGQPWRKQAAALDDVALAYEDAAFAVYRVRPLQPPWHRVAP